MPLTNTRDKTWHSLLLEHRQLIDACACLEIPVIQAAQLIENSLNRDGKVILCGNGGSFAHAQHFAAELVVRYRQNREPVRAVTLGCNQSVVTAVNNDLDAEEIFEREFRAVVGNNDCLVAFSTSGRSKNVIRALEIARAIRIPTLGITGIHGMATVVDSEIRVPSSVTALIQQVHTIIIHALCEALGA